MSTYQAKRSRVPRRAPRACQQCRTAKVRCSGAFPCTRCTRRHDNCVFPEDDPKVAVSEKYLLDIERRIRLATASTVDQTAPEQTTNDTASIVCATSTKNSSATGKNSDNASNFESSAKEGSNPPQSLNRVEDNDRDIAPVQTPPPNDSEEGPSNGGDSDQPSPVFTNNPLVKDAPYIRDPAGRYRYMGPTSTWSFFRRVVTLLESFYPQSPHTASSPFNFDGTAFRLKWVPVSPDEMPDISDLPPTDYALYLFHTVKFHLGQLFQLVDEPAFLSRLHLLETNALELARTQRLWFVEYFLILAFGEAFVNRAGPGSAPAGSNYAARGMALLPDVGQLHDEGLLAIEVLGLAALYFHSCDMRVSAYQYIGQALRLSYVEGIQREMPEDIVGSEFATRCRSLWWTVYILDRRLSALMGAPSSIRDEDITASLPSQIDSSSIASAATLSIKLSRLLATITTTVYGSNEKLGSSFIKNTKSVITSLAEVAQEGDEMMMAQSQSINPSRVMSAITLMYHHCILQATRPLVMCLLKVFLGITESNSGRETWISPPIVALLKTSISSAFTTLRILCTLEKQKLLECFLPFDVEYAFSSATLLCIVQTILPKYIEDRSWRSMTSLLFDVMINQGSVPAGLRKSELCYLEELLAGLCPSGPIVEVEGAILSPVAAPCINQTMIEDPGGYQNIWDLGFDMDFMNPEPDQLFDLAFQLDVDTETNIIGNL